MPRIAPEQLIKCLAVLLTPGGGIKSTEEVGRLVQLMQKFSKKLVSKCVYVSILKNTELGLLSDFMQHGGWALVFTWLQKAIDNQNQFFIQEILDLLVLCPVDVTRLKSNNIPKLVKTLSKSGQFGDGVQELAVKIVAKWLAIVKGVTASVASEVDAPVQEEEKTDPVPPLKITLKKDGKNLVRKSSEDESVEETKVTKTKRSEDISHEKTKCSSRDTRDSKKHRSTSSTDSKHRSSDKHSEKLSSDKHRSSEHRDKSSSDRSSSDKSKSSRDKEKDRSSKSSSSSSSSSSSTKNYLKERERERERTKRKEKEKEEKESKLTKMEKDRQVETDQATLARLMVPSINKLGKIPKKADKDKINQMKENIGKTEDKKETPVTPNPPSEQSKKNYSFSIEKRTPSDQKPKTVKTFNAKFRSTGLEEESAKPPPQRGKTSSSSSTPSSTSSPSDKKSGVKRASPGKDLPPEKKLKSSSDHSSSSHNSADKSSSPNEKTKVPPKPKVMFLQESDVFSSALNDAILVKDTKKKKRKLSTSKEETKEKENKVTSPTGNKTPEESKPAFKFYRDTLESIPEEKKTSADTDVASDTEHNTTPPASPTEEISTKPSEDTEQSKTPPQQPVEKCNIEFVSRPPDQPIKGVLSYLKNPKRVKKAVQFKTPEQGLENVFYFELDETERCNVSRPNSFMDMRSMERELERENFSIARKLTQEDVQAERTVWTTLIPIDISNTTVVETGKNSREREIQKARQMTVRPTIYGGYSVIPPSPAEPDFEVHATTDPLLMPAEDSTSEGTYDYRTIPWPEPLPAEPFSIGPPPMMAPALMGPGPMGPMMGPPGIFPPAGPFPPGPGPMPNGNNWMGPVPGPVPADMPQGAMPMGGPMPPNMPFPPGMNPMGMNMGPGGPMMNGPMPPDMMMNGPPGFGMSGRPMGPPGMFMGPPPGPWFGPGGPGIDMNGPPMEINQGPPPNIMNQGHMNQGPLNEGKGPMNENINNGGEKLSSRNKPGGSWHRGGEPNRDRDRGRERDRDKRGGIRPRSTIPCRHKKFCKNRDCPYMHPSSR